MSPQHHDAPLAGKQPIGMLDPERERPWLYAALYGATIVLALLASHLAAGGA